MKSFRVLYLHKTHPALQVYSKICHRKIKFVKWCLSVVNRESQEAEVTAEVAFAAEEVS